MDVVTRQEVLIPCRTGAAVKVVLDVASGAVAHTSVELAAIVGIGIESFALASTATTTGVLRRTLRRPCGAGTLRWLTTRRRRSLLLWLLCWWLLHRRLCRRFCWWLRRWLSRRLSRWLSRRQSWRLRRGLCRRLNRGLRLSLTRSQRWLCDFWCRARYRGSRTLTSTRLSRGLTRLGCRLIRTLAWARLLSSWWRSRRRWLGTTASRYSAFVVTGL